MTHEWKVGDKCKLMDEGECEITAIGKSTCLVYNKRKDEEWHALTSALRPIAKPPKLPTGKIRIDLSGDKVFINQCGRYNSPQTDVHIINLRDHWLMQAFVELVDAGDLYHLCDGSGRWQSRATGRVWTDWQSAVLDLRPDLREALGEGES